MPRPWWTYPLQEGFAFLVCFLRPLLQEGFYRPLLQAESLFFRLRGKVYFLRPLSQEGFAVLVCFLRPLLQEGFLRPLLQAETLFFRLRGEGFARDLQCPGPGGLTESLLFKAPITGRICFFRLRGEGFAGRICFFSMLSKAPITGRIFKAPITGRKSIFLAA